MTAGTLNANAQPITLSGGWVNTAGTFNVNGSTISFVGSAAQKINNPASQSFAVLIDSNTSNGGLVFVSSITAAQFPLNPPPPPTRATVSFHPATPFTITTPTL